MTPAFVSSLPWAELPVETRPIVVSLLAALLHEVGRPISRTARTVRSGKLAIAGFRTLLWADLFGTAAPGDVPDGQDAPRRRFEQLTQALAQAWPALATEPRIRGVAAQLDSIEQLRAALLANDEAATAQAMGIALSIERLLEELLAEVERDPVSLSPRGEGSGTRR